MSILLIGRACLVGFFKMLVDVMTESMLLLKRVFALGLAEQHAKIESP